MTARLTTVTNTLELPGGAPFAGQPISFELNVPLAYTTDGLRQKVRRRYTETDAAGTWSMALEVNDDLDPANTSWTVRQARGLVQTFVVTYSLSPVPLRECLVDDPTSPSLVPGVTLAQLNTAVQAAVNGLIAGAPGALDTLNELAAALGDDANFATTVTNALALKAPLASPNFTGTPQIGGVALTALFDAANAAATAQAFAVQRSHHTGTQASTTITGLAAVATSGAKADVGLGSVDNTADAAKPVSTAQAAADTAVQTAAATDATTKANNAQSAATTAAAADATTKANAAQAFAIQRGNHTGTQSADTLTDGTTNKAFLATERTQLATNTSNIASNTTAINNAPATYAAIVHEGPLRVDRALAGAGDITTQVQALANLLPTAYNGQIHFPAAASAYTFEGVVVPTGASLKISGEGDASVLSDVAGSLPILKVGSGGANTDYFAASDVYFSSANDRPYDQGLLYLNWIRSFDLNHVRFGMSGTGTSLILDTSYNGSVDKCYFRGGRYSVGVEMNSVANPTAQQDTIDFRLTKIYTAHAVIIRHTNGNYHGIRFPTTKMLAIAPDFGVTLVESTVSTATAVGDTVIPVVSSAGFSVGDPVFLGVDLSAEVNKITAVAAGQVTVLKPLRFVHAIGDPVIKGGVLVSASSNNYGLKFDAAHFEGTAFGVIGKDIRALAFEDCYSGVGRLYRPYNTTTSVRFGQTVMGGSNGVNTVIDSTYLAAANPTDVYIDGPILKTSGGPTVVPVEGGKIAHSDPMRLGYATTILSIPSFSQTTWAAANQSRYVRVYGAKVISKVALQVMVQSGNIDVGAYTQTGTGRTASPDQRLSSSGSVPCPAVGYAEVSMGAAVPVNHGDYLALACDNATVQFRMGVGDSSQLGARLSFAGTSQFPLPSSAALTVSQATLSKVPGLIGVV